MIQALSTGRTLAEEAGAHVLSKLIVMHFSPLEATITTYVICVLVAIFIGFIIFYINLLGNNSIGVGVALFMVLWSMFIEGLPHEAYCRMLYFSPATWTDISFFLKGLEGSVPFWYALLFLIIADTVLAVLIMIKAKSYNMEVMEEV